MPVAAEVVVPKGGEPVTSADPLEALRKLERTVAQLADEVERNGVIFEQAYEGDASLMTWKRRFEYALKTLCVSMSIATLSGGLLKFSEDVPRILNHDTFIQLDLSTLLTSLSVLIGSAIAMVLSKKKVNDAAVRVRGERGLEDVERMAGKRKNTGNYKRGNRKNHRRSSIYGSVIRWIAEESFWLSNRRFSVRLEFFGSSYRSCLELLTSRILFASVDI